MVDISVLKVITIADYVDISVLKVNTIADYGRH